MNTNYHEQESVTLKALESWPRKQLHSFLRKRGFKSVDDSYKLTRSGRSHPWQSSTIVSIRVFCARAEIYETEEDIEEGLGTTWDELRCDYLLATLPRDCIADFVDEVEALAVEFDLQVHFDGGESNRQGLSKHLNKIADDLTVQWDAPGSEGLRMLIELGYN